MIRKHYYSIQERIINGKGQRNIVSIKNNGSAVKTVEKLGTGGKILKRKTRKLTAKEKSHILKGTFVPRLWSNCTFKNCRKQ